MSTPQTVKVFKALADETRMDIALQLARAGELSCQKLSEQNSNLSQPAISHHFKKLAEAGVVLVRKEGTQHFYSLDQKYLARLGLDLRKIK